MLDVQTINRTLARLRAAADRTITAWPTIRWEKVDGSGPESLGLDGAGVFAGLELEPGRDLILRCRVDAPTEAAGVSLIGDPLEVTIFSLYPIDLSWNGEQIFEDAVAPVAAGPALVQVVPQ